MVVIIADALQIVVFPYFCRRRFMARRCRTRACADDTELVLLHQDAFAADYQEDEYTLLGMAIEYAGHRGKEVRVIGKNRQTLEADTIQ